MNTQEITQKLNDLRAKGSNMILTAKKDANGDYILTNTQFEEIRARQDEVNALSIDLESARAKDFAKSQEELAEAKSRIDAIEAATINNPLAKMGYQADPLTEMLAKGFGANGKMLRDTEIGHDFGFEGIKGFLAGGEQKTNMTLAAGWAAPVVRSPGFVEALTRPVQLLDLVRAVPAGLVNSYMVESTFTNNAAEAAEAGSYGEAALAYTETADAIRKIAVFLPVTDEQLNDVGEVENIIRNRLAFMVRQRLDGQIAVGDGSAPNLRGLYNATNVQTQARGADTILDAILKAIGKVNGSGSTIWANANFLTTTSADWYTLMLAKDSQNRYLLGDPANMTAPRVWGLQVALSDAMTADTGLVGDMSFAELRVQTDLNIKASDSHSDFFIKGLNAIRADIRVALRIYRGQAFCKITDFTA